MLIVSFSIVYPSSADLNPRTGAQSLSVRTSGHNSHFHSCYYTGDKAWILANVPGRVSRARSSMKIPLPLSVTCATRCETRPRAHRQQAYNTARWFSPMRCLIRPICLLSFWIHLGVFPVTTQQLWQQRKLLLWSIGYLLAESPLQVTMVTPESLRWAQVPLPRRSFVHNVTPSTQRIRWRLLLCNRVTLLTPATPIQMSRMSVTGNGTGTCLHTGGRHFKLRRCSIRCFIYFC